MEKTSKRNILYKIFVKNQTLQAWQFQGLQLCDLIATQIYFFNFFHLIQKLTCSKCYIELIELFLAYKLSKWLKCLIERI